MIFSNISESMGKTPLVRLNKIKAGTNTILVKTEARNPAGSVKDRVAWAMVDDAIKSGALKEGMTIIEPTSGNTGIGLAAVGRARGFKVKIAMPESMSIERRKIMTGLGAELVLTPAAEGMSGAIKTAESLLMDNPGQYYMPQQFKNPANPAIHAITTGPEIDLDSNGKVDAVVAGVGTGGTITGIAHYYNKIKKAPIEMVAVEPAASPVISQALAGEELRPGKHGIQGIGAGFIPMVLELDYINHVIPVDDAEAFDCAMRLMREEGILCGISGGAALTGALHAAEQLGWENKTIAVILPDSGERYLSTALFG
jgi:cysteine synthase A